MHLQLYRVPVEALVSLTLLTSLTASALHPSFAQLKQLKRLYLNFPSEDFLLSRSLTKKQLLLLL